MKTSTKLWMLAGVLMMAGTSHAQTETSTGFYRLDFVTKELDDTKVINTRTYSMVVSEKSQGSIRAGTKLPVPSGRGGDNFQFFDVGVNIDCRDVREALGQLTLRVNADISSVAVDAGLLSSPVPVIRTYRWDSTVVVPMRKAIQIYSSDDLSSKRKFQLELTATPIK